LARRRQRWKERQEKKRNNQSSMIFEQLQTEGQSQSHDNYDSTNNGEWLS
jgi:hypothetical protein